MANTKPNATQIRYDGGTLSEFFRTKSSRLVNSISELRALSKSVFSNALVVGYYGAGDGGGGIYWLDASDNTSADNGGTVIVAADGGRWKLTDSVKIDIRQFGAKGDGATDDTAAFELVADSGLRMAAGTTLLNAARISRGNVHGRGMNTVLKAMTAATSVLRLGWTSVNGSWAPRKLSEMMIDGNAKASDGVAMWAATNHEISGRWTLDSIALANCNRAIYKPSGNIGNRFRDFSISGCNYGYYAVGQSEPLMHAGCDVLSSGEINSCGLAAVYIDSPQIGTGGTALRDMILEYNTGFGVFVKNWADSYTPLIFDNVWFEGNATASSVNINGTNYPPKDMRLENTAMAVITNGMMPPKLELVNSRLHIENSVINDGTSAQYSIDANSVLTAERLSIDGGVHPIIVGSLVRARRPSGNSAQVHYAKKRFLKNGVLSQKLQSIPFDGAGPFPFTGSSAVDGSSVPDGQIFGSCCEVVVPAGATLLQGAATITAEKWYVVTVDARLVSGSSAGLTFGALYDVSLATDFNKLLSSDWKTIASVSKCPAGGGGNVRMYINNATGAEVRLRLSAWQIMQFDTEQAAIDYYNGGAYFK